MSYPNWGIARQELEKPNYGTGQGRKKKTFNRSRELPTKLQLAKKHIFECNQETELIEDSYIPCSWAKPILEQFDRLGELYANLW